MSLFLRQYGYIAIPVGAVCCIPWMYRKFSIPVYDVPANLKGRTYIVTGATRGIGEAAVRALAPSGARVIMACRDLDECKILRRKIAIEAKNRQVVCRPCDLSSFESIKNFAAKIINEEHHVDALINNAGLKFVRPRKINQDNMEHQLVVNFLGSYLLTMLLKEKLEAAEAGRIVNVIGSAYKKGSMDWQDVNGELKYHPDKAYFQSKLGLALVTQELAKEFSASGVCVNGVDPGHAYTDIERYTAPYFKLLRAGFYKLSRRSAAQAAYPLLYAALSLDLHGVSGKFISKSLTVTDFDQVTADPFMRRKTWLLARKWTDVEQAKNDVQRILSTLSGGAGVASVAS